MKIVFLGTACMIPTKERNHQAILLTYKNENILFDCGENTQRQLKIAGISPTKITKIFITHWHSDHILGLPGLLQTLAANNYQKTLEIYGPNKTKYFMSQLFKTFILNTKLKISIHEIKRTGKVLENEGFTISAQKLKHRNISCLAYSFEELSRRRININYIKHIGLPQGPLLGKLQKGQAVKYKGQVVSVNRATYSLKGKKLTILLDTENCKECLQIAKDSDILISEATYSDNLKNKAKEYKHLTAKEAALIAKKSNSKRLILTHFSQRYGDVKELEREAKKYFKNTLAARDFMVVNL